MEYDKLMDPIKLCYIIDNINIIDENEDYQNIENAVEEEDDEDDEEDEEEEDEDEEDEEEEEATENDEEKDEESTEKDEESIEKDDNIKVDGDDKKEDNKEEVKEEIDDKGEVNIKEECINVDSLILENNNEITNIKDIQLLAENKEIKVEVPIKENKKKRKYIKKNHTEFKEFNKNIIQEFKNSN